MSVPGGALKSWTKKLIEQFEMDWTSSGDKSTAKEVELSEERATLLYLIDVLNKNLFEIDNHSVRRVRENLDEFAKAMIDPNNPNIEKVLFRFRQFYSSYRIDEYTYLQRNFEEFKSIIWDFADQLGEDLQAEEQQDELIGTSLDQLREAVESNSLDVLRTKSREFIDFYIEQQTHKSSRKEKRLQSMEKNLHSVKKKLLEANQAMRTDHMTGAFNRKSFDEQMKRYIQLHQFSKAPVSFILLDIDHFKKVNDTYGHDIGDFVLKECVRLLKEIFHRPNDFVARLGGEEFGVILPDFNLESAARKAEEAMQKIRREALVTGEHVIRFTVSMGIAQLHENEHQDAWVKRADECLYESKNSGRNKYTLSQNGTKPIRVA